jgi:hypothetical protein
MEQGWVLNIEKEISQLVNKNEVKKGWLSSCFDLGIEEP